jgi:endonuclease YncB( thermonuclease family)
MGPRIRSGWKRTLSSGVVSSRRRGQGSGRSGGLSCRGTRPRKHPATQSAVLASNGYCDKLASMGIAFLLISAIAAGTVVSGTGRAIDGDSLRVGQYEVRLFGIDAPEARQTCSRQGQPWTCGLASADQLAKLANGQQVNCIAVGLDRYRRVVARCSVGSRELNRYMVATGYAVAFRRYSTEYVSAEESAKAAKRGIWSSKFELPSQFRDDGGYIVAQSPADVASSTERVNQRRGQKSLPTGSCRIKGNHSRKGELIYHLPGMPYYDQTVAEEVFCTEAQARAAGYRRSRADLHR